MAKVPDFAVDLKYRAGAVAKVAGFYKGNNPAAAKFVYPGAYTILGPGGFTVWASKADYDNGATPVLNVAWGAGAAAAKA